MLAISLVLYNSDSWLERLIESLAADPAARDAHWVVIDNGLEETRRLDVFEENGLSGQYIRPQTNLYYGRGNNLVLQSSAVAARRSFVLVINPDIWFEPSAVSTLVQSALENPGFGIIGALQMEYDSHDHSDWAPQDPLDSMSEQSRVMETGRVEGSCMLISTECLEVVGGFDPIYEMYYEDVDLCRRAELAGFEVGIATSARYHHYSDASFGDQNAIDRVKRIDRSQFIFQLTNPGHSWAGNHIRVARWLLARTFKWLTFRQPGFGFGIYSIAREYLANYRALRDNWGRRYSGDYSVQLPEPGVSISYVRRFGSGAESC